MQDYRDGQMGDRVEDRHLVTKNFEKMRTHFDCLEELKREHGNLNNGARLRELLKHNSFLLGLEHHSNKSLELELKFFKQNSQRLINENLGMHADKRTNETQLNKVKERIYNIDFDAY